MAEHFTSARAGLRRGSQRQRVASIVFGPPLQQLEYETIRRTSQLDFAVSAPPALRDFQWWCGQLLTEGLEVQRFGLKLASTGLSTLSV